MFKSLSICAMAALCIVAEGSAQNLKPVGFIEENGKVELALAPSSALVVDITIEHESTVVGPYARYAQKFLGLRAPLVDKEVTTIISTDIALAPEDYYIAKCAPATGVEVISSQVQELPIDIISSRAVAPEDAAEEAASSIFDIRSLRNEILRGDLGEGFYSGGLTAALERFDYEEKRYIEMFMGRTTRTRESRRFIVQLTDSKTTQFEVCKYSASEGLESEKGELIVVKLTPSKGPSLTSREVTDKSKVFNFRVPADVKCELMIGNKTLSSKTLPLYEYGVDYAYPIYTK